MVSCLVDSWFTWHLLHFIFAELPRFSCRVNLTRERVISYEFEVCCHEALGVYLLRQPVSVEGVSDLPSTLERSLLNPETKIHKH